MSQQFFEQFHFLRGILIYFWLSRFKGSCGKIDFDLSVTVQVELFGQAQSISSFLSAVGHLAALHFNIELADCCCWAQFAACVFDRRVDTQILNSWQTLAGPSFPKVDVHHIIPSRTANWLSVCCVHVYDHSLITAPGLVLLLLNATKLGALFSHILRLLTYLLSSFLLYVFRNDPAALSIGSRAPSNIQRPDLSVCIIQSGPQLAGLVFFFFFLAV